MRAPNPDCPVCSVAQTRLAVNLSRATLNDLVENFLRVQLGYGDEFVVSSDTGTLYDVEETENLSKKLSELGSSIRGSTITCYHANITAGIKHNSFLTITDDDEENPRVNLVLSIQES